MDTLEQDAIEVLCLVWTLKNSFTPIFRIPPEVLSLIPVYCDDDDEDDVDQSLIALTHVCRGWRNVFTSCPSLWTRLNFTNVNKTCMYIQRSHSFPLEIYLDQDINYLDNAFSLVIPHLHQLKSLIVDVDFFPDVLKHFHCQVPLLKELCIYLWHSRNLIQDGVYFDGGLSSLHKLTLRGLITIMHLPWNNMANLNVFELRCWPPGHDITQLLDFFKSTPLLHMVNLVDSIPQSSDVPPQ